MKMLPFTLAFTAVLMVPSSYAGAQQMDPNMSGMTGMQQGAKDAEVQGTGVVKAIDVANGTITLQHQPIEAISWPAMTMAFKVASLDLVESVEVGDKVQFGLHPAGIDSTITSIKRAQP